jgi:hypothetical protein
VAPPFHYVEKGDENENLLLCLRNIVFFCFVKQETKFRGKNFMKFRIFHDTKFCEIRNELFREISRNFVSRSFVSRNFIDPPTLNLADLTCTKLAICQI